MPHRYFTTEISDGTAVLRGADAHHLSRVMRGKLGDTVILCDGSAVEYTATITGFGDETVEFSVEPGYPSAAEPTVAFYRLRPQEVPAGPRAGGAVSGYCRPDRCHPLL